MERRGREERSCASSYQKIVNVGFLAIDRPSAEPLRRPDHLPFLDPPLLPETRVHLAGLPPRYHHLRPTIGLVHLIFGPFSHRHRFSDGPRSFAVPHAENSQWNSLRRTFCQTSILDNNRENPRSFSPAANPLSMFRYPFDFKWRNYVIVAWWGRKWSTSKIESRLVIVRKISREYCIFKKKTLSSNYILLYFWLRIFLMNFIRKYTYNQ